MIGNEVFLLVIDLATKVLLVVQTRYKNLFLIENFKKLFSKYMQKCFFSCYLRRSFYI